MARSVSRSPGIVVMRYAAGLATAQVQGSMEPGFNMGPDDMVPNLRAMHLALIPKGPYRGWAVLWDGVPHSPTECFSSPFTDWGMFNPDASPRVFVRSLLSHGTNNGYLACCGTGWTMDGRMVVVGGNIKHNLQQMGCSLVQVFSGRTGQTLRRRAGVAHAARRARLPGLLALHVDRRAGAHHERNRGAGSRLRVLRLAVAVAAHRTGDARVRPMAHARSERARRWRDGGALVAALTLDVVTTQTGCRAAKSTALA